MFIEMKRIVVEKGTSQPLIDKFSKAEMVKQAPGYVEHKVLKRVRNSENEEIIVQFVWESQEAFTNWKKSDAHKAGHANKGSKASNVIESSMDTYTVEN